MNLGFRYDARGVRGWAAALFGIVLVFGLVAGAAGDLPKDRPARSGARGLGPSTVALGFTMDVNRVIMSLTDKAEIGAAFSSVSGGGAWRAVTDQYVFSSGVNIGATVVEGAGLDTLVMIGGPFSELRPGRLAEFETRSGSILPGSDLAVFWLSTDPQDYANFPLVCTVDQVRIATFPSLQPFEGEPFPGFADLTACFAANDVDGATCSDCGGTRLGAETNQTYFAFSIPAVQDFFFVAMRIFNRSEFVTPTNTPGNPVFGPYDFLDTVVAIAIDPDVGNAGDDQIGFVGSAMVYWDADFSEPAFQFEPPGFGGLAYLKTPEDPETGEEVGLQNFTVFTNGGARPDPGGRQEWYEGMTGDPDFVVFDVSPQDVRGMASSGPFPLPAGGFVEIYAAFFFAEPFGQVPATLTTDVAVVNGEPIPLFNNFISTQAAVQGLFDAGFLVPTAPPSPQKELIPGDHQVTVVWELDPTTAVNPFAKVALDPFLRTAAGDADPDAAGLGTFVGADQIIFVPALDAGGTTGFVTAAEGGLAGVEVTNPLFNADFVIQDFQGFRVYRSFTGNQDDAELIAQFDLADGIIEGEFCVEGTAVGDPDDPFVVCTESEVFSIGTDTGLSLAVVDRGGSFPNPASGPGLINGIPVYYAVTSFGVNCGVMSVVGLEPEQLPDLDIPAGCLTLESGIQLTPATPRSNASAFVDASVGAAVLLDGDGNEVPRDSGPIPVDADGNLTGPIPPARDWDLNVNIVQPLEIPENFEVLVHIDDFSGSASHTVEFQVFCHSFDNLGTCTGFGAPFAEVPAGPSNLGEKLILTLTDGAGNVLQTPTGPAAGLATGFGPGNFNANTPISTPEIQILSPLNPENGVALTIQYSTNGGRRDGNCATFGTCPLVNEMPASVAQWGFARGNYLQTRVATIELTWSNQAGELSFSSVRDVSNNVDVTFADHLTHVAWGFHSPTRLRALEDALATEAGTPRTDDGRVLFPDPLCTAAVSFFNCQWHHTAGPFTQGAPIWTDLPVDPAIFDKLAAGPDWPSDPSFFQPGALQQTAALVTIDGNRATRFWIAGHTLAVVFNQLPADGETWTLHFPRGTAGTAAVDPNTVRGPVAGMAVRVPISGGTNELADADLQLIRVVPNPFIAANEITRGRGRQRILFTNLPPQATIRIYTISGNLVRILEHTSGSGTTEWDVRTRFDLLVASGNYYYHVTTPDGRTHLGRFAVIN